MDTPVDSPDGDTDHMEISSDSSLPLVASHTPESDGEFENVVRLMVELSNAVDPGKRHREIGLMRLSRRRGGTLEYREILWHLAFDGRGMLAWKGSGGHAHART